MLVADLYLGTRRKNVSKEMKVDLFLLLIDWMI